MANVNQAWKHIDTYRAFFLERGPLPLVGQTDEGIIAIGEACREAVLRSQPLTDDEAAALAPNAPAGADI